MVESKDRSLTAFTGTQNTGDKKRISLAEMLKTQIPFTQHIHGNLQGKQDQKLVQIYKFICLNFFVHCKTFTHIPFTLKFRRNF